MKNKLLITTAIVGLSFASSALAAETVISTQDDLNAALSDRADLSGTQITIKDATGLNITAPDGVDASTALWLEGEPLSIEKSSLTVDGTGSYLGWADVAIDQDSEVTLTNGGHLLTARSGDNDADALAINSNGTINLVDGGIIRATSVSGETLPTDNDDFSVINLNGTTNVKGEGNIIASRETNVGGAFNIAKNAALDLVGYIKKIGGTGGDQFFLNTNLDDDVKASEGNFNVNGTLSNAGTLNANGVNVNFADGSTYEFAVNETATEGGVINGNVKLDGDVNLKTDVSHVKLGATQYQFVNGNVDAENGAWSVIDGSLTNNLYNVSLNENNAQIDFKAKSSNEINLGSSNENKAIGAVIAGGEAEGNTAFNNVANNISTLLQSSNPADVAKGLKMVDQMSVEAAPAATTVSTETANAVFGAVGSRLSGGSAAGKQGMSSGDNYLENGAVWAQGMYNKSKLDKANGFDADTNGIAFGAEKNITNTTKAGIGYAYSTTDIDSDSRTTDVDTHTAIAYGEYKPSNWYVNGIATYSWGSYDENSAIKSAKYDVDSIGLQAMTGYEMLMNNNLMVTPEAGMRYVNIKQKSYTDSLGNKVGEKTDDVWTGVAGVKVSKDFALDNGMTLRPEARVALTYDLTQADSSSVVTLANGSSYAADADPLKRFGQEIGLGLTAEVNDNVELNVGYEGRFRSDYTDHTGLLNAKYKF